MGKRKHVYELTLILEIDRSEATDPSEWGIEEAFDLPGVTLIDVGFLPVEYELSEIN